MSSKSKNAIAQNASQDLREDVRGLLKELQRPGGLGRDVVDGTPRENVTAGAPGGMDFSSGRPLESESGGDSSSAGEVEKIGEIGGGAEFDENGTISSTAEAAQGGRFGLKMTVFEDSSDEEGSSSEFANGEKGKLQEEAAEELEKWYEAAERVLGKRRQETSDKTKKKKIGLEDVGKLRNRAENALAGHCKQRAQELAKDTNVQWMKKMMKSGTLSDKVAAMALSISSQTVENLYTLEILVGMTAKKGRREIQLATDALTDLFLNNLLPSDRPLLGFNERASSLSQSEAKRISDEELLFWMVEAEVKRHFLGFIRSLERWAFDNLEYTKRMAISAAFKLLKEKPEQEGMLLLLLVKKLGDTQRKLASHVVFVLCELIKAHPNMRGIVVREIEQFIFRQNARGRGVYYATMFLNQIELRRGTDKHLAQNLINIYIRLFRVAVKLEKEHPEENPSKKVVVASNPSSKKSKKQSRQADSSNGKVFISFQEMKSKLLSAILTGVNRAFPFAESKGESFDEQIDVLFQMVHVSSFSTSTQVLMLLLHIMQSREVVSHRFYQALYRKLQSSELRMASRRTTFLNVLYRAMKLDPDLNRCRAFVKRIAQIALCASAAFAAGALVLIDAVMQAKPQLRKMIGPIKSQEMAIQKSKKKKAKCKRDSNLVLLVDERQEETFSNETSVHVPSEEEKERLSHGKDDASQYDPRKRDPRFAGCSSNTKLWEMQGFFTHYHPTIRKFAGLMLDASRRETLYEGDPLRDFSENAFLDRFVYRNPRKRDIENLKRKDNKFGIHGKAARMGRKAIQKPVNSASFLMQDESLVNEEERFFHQYFHLKAESEGRDLRAELAAKIEEERQKSGADGEDEGAFLDDQEEEIDAYADVLAEGILERQFGRADVDDDDLMVDFDEMNEEVSLEDSASDDGDDDEDKKGNDSVPPKKRIKKGTPMASSADAEEFQQIIDNTVARAKQERKYAAQRGKWKR